MKQKPDETPDEWVRQMLNRLPDAPPPGSSFDSARLWNQLRPELQPKPARRQAWWWAAAACLAGLLIGWRLLFLPGNQPMIHPATQAAYAPRPDSASSYSPTPVPDALESAPEITKAYRVKKQRNSTFDQRITTSASVATAPEPTEPEPIAQVTEPPATSIVQSVPVPRKATVAANTPKRRFRVMHENELRAEDEAAPKIYPTNHFVRLGSGPRHEDQRDDNQRNNTAPDNSPPTLVMPLKTH